jgi:hypothetical protein
VTPTLAETWEAMGVVSARFYCNSAGALAGLGERWYAAVSGEENSDLNLAGLHPGATGDDCNALLELVGERAAIVFPSSAVHPDAIDVLTGAGFGVVSTPEPLMRCDAPPAGACCSLRIAPAIDPAEVAVTAGLMGEAHRIAPEMIARVITPLAGDAEVTPWLAWDAGTALSVVWTVRSGDRLGVLQMMTPERYQRRGAGRAVLSTALRAEWERAPTRFAVLQSSPAGRRLYTSLGFAAVDECMTRFRGADEATLAAIGQRPAAS